MTEDDIAPLAGPAFAAAFHAAIAAGCSVLEARDGTLVEVLPDGTERVVREIARATAVKVGDRYSISDR